MTRTTSKHVQDILELLVYLKRHNGKAERDIIRNAIKDGRLSKNTAAIINAFIFDNQSDGQSSGRI